MVLASLFFPLLVAIGILFVDKNATKLIKNLAVFGSLFPALFALIAFFQFDLSNSGYQFTTSLMWIPQIDCGFRVGVDGMSMLLINLTTFSMPIALLASYNSVSKRVKEYYAMLLLLEFGMIGVFISLDVFLFYVFWELILIPMYFIIGIWGGKDRLYASIKFFLYTMVGSLFMLIAIVWLGFLAQQFVGHFSTDYLVLKSFAEKIDPMTQSWLFAAFALSFLIKVPIFPLHTWLPDAHVQAPTAGSVILASVLLKMGTYGLIRFNLELFPQASIAHASFISILAVIGIIYGALVAMVQTDIKKLVAYSSVSHMGFIVLGIFSMTVEGIQGGIIQMINHGLTTGMLFLCVGVIYERRHTRELSEFGGLAKVMPMYSVFLGLAMFGSVGLPGLNGFVGEYLTLLGAFQSKFLNNWWFAIISASGVIFAAVYLMKMYQSVAFGEISNEENRSLRDLSSNEILQLVPMAIFVIWIGVYPSTFMKVSEKSTQALVGKLEKLHFGVSKYVSEMPSASK